MKNLHPDIDDEELREMFSFFGDIDNVKVLCACIFASPFRFKNECAALSKKSAAKRKKANDCS